MDLLKEFLDPLPLPIMVLAIFGLILFWLIGKCFRLPDNFQAKEAVREAVRFKLFDQEMNSEDEEEGGDEGASEEDKGKDANEGEKTAAAATVADPPSN
jgi:hypothetical protein